MTTQKIAIRRASSRPCASDTMASGDIIRKADGSYQVTLKISDPAAKQDVQALRNQIARSPKQAEAFLREAGILTPKGRLTKRFGG